MSAGDNMVPRHDRMLHMARAAKPRSRYDLSPKQIIMARHMANDGASTADVLAALGWVSQRNYAVQMLAKKYRIFPRNSFGHAHRGEATSLPLSDAQQPVHIQYRPKRVRS